MTSRPSLREQAVSIWDSIFVLSSALQTHIGHRLSTCDSGAVLHCAVSPGLVWVICLVCSFSTRKLFRFFYPSSAPKCRLLTAAVAAVRISSRYSSVQVGCGSLLCVSTRRRLVGFLWNKRLKPRTHLNQSCKEADVGLLRFFQKPAAVKFYIS